MFGVDSLRGLKSWYLCFNALRSTTSYLSPTSTRNRIPITEKNQKPIHKFISFNGLFWDRNQTLPSSTQNCTSESTIAAIRSAQVRWTRNTKKTKQAILLSKRLKECKNKKNTKIETNKNLSTFKTRTIKKTLTKQSLIIVNSHNPAEQQNCELNGNLSRSSAVVNGKTAKSLCNLIEKRWQSCSCNSRKKSQSSTFEKSGQPYPFTKKAYGAWLALIKKEWKHLQNRNF